MPALKDYKSSIGSALQSSISSSRYLSPTGLRPDRVGFGKVHAGEGKDVPTIGVDLLPRMVSQQLPDVARKSGGTAWSGFRDEQQPLVVGVKHFVLREDNPAAEEGDFLQRQENEVLVLLPHGLAVIPPPSEQLGDEARRFVQRLGAVG